MDREVVEQKLESLRRCLEQLPPKLIRMDEGGFALISCY